MRMFLSHEALSVFFTVGTMTQTDLEGDGAYVHLKSKKPSNNPPIQATTLLHPARERQSAAASEKIKSRWLPAVLRAGAWRAPQMLSSRWGRKTRSAAALEAAEVWSERPEGNLGCSSGIAHQPVGNDRHTGRRGGQRFVRQRSSAC